LRKAVLRSNGKCGCHPKINLLYFIYSRQPWMSNLIFYNRLSVLRRS
jgi:hypothetical protein